MPVFPILTIFSLTVLTLVYLVYRQPAWLIGYMQRRWPDVLFQVPTKQKIVALTIDDGPSPDTAEIHRVLDSHNAKATFFLIGSHIPGWEETLQDLVRNGHELANHALHDEPSRSLPSGELIRQIELVEMQIAAIYTFVNRTELRPRYFRPGSGFFSTSIRQVLQALNCRLVLGSIYPHDAQIQWQRLNAWHILSGVKPGGIIVCHDRKWTAPMLRIVLPELKRRGYRVVTVTRLLCEGAGQ